MKLRYLWAVAALFAIALVRMSDTVRVTWIYNATPSVPVGWYHVDYTQPIAVGQLVAWKPPAMWDDWLQQRGYIAKKMVLIKAVAAAGGQQICVDSHGDVFMQQRIVARTRSYDSQGRSMPRLPEGCRQLQAGEYFLLGRHPSSIDSRYMGTAHASELVGVVRPLKKTGPASKSHQ